MRLLHLLVWLLLTALSFPATGQTSDDQHELTVEKPLQLHSPHKASVYSAILPGLGQAYNKKYWKIPVVYAGIGTITYFAMTNRSEYRLAREAFNYVSNEDDYPIDNKYVGKYPANDLITIRDYYRRNMELSWIILGAWYLINIIDATVDAHLFYYDISDELALQLLTPSIPVAMPVIQGRKDLPAQQFLTLKISF